MELGFDKETFQKKIIAVAGAKGGVGKSVFAANLAVYLSVKGFKTVVVDLDLGGANVHLYLGKSFLLKQSINDFLRNRSQERLWAVSDRWEQFRIGNRQY